MSALTVRELQRGETELAYAALHDLRAEKPALENRATFVHFVDDIMRAEGYRLAAAFSAGIPDAIAVCGFRIFHMLYSEKQLYVDDLVTRPEFRRCGGAAALFSFIREAAATAGCRTVHLDSGYNRSDAHRFYLNHGLRMTSHHFSTPREELR
jgi:GNAT superfamily N-acetyltransferase